MAVVLVMLPQVCYWANYLAAADVAVAGVEAPAAVGAVAQVADLEASAVVAQVVVAPVAAGNYLPSFTNHIENIFSIKVLFANYS